MIGRKTRTTEQRAPPRLKAVYGTVGDVRP